MIRILIDYMIRQYDERKLLLYYLQFENISF